MNNPSEAAKAMSQQESENYKAVILKRLDKYQQDEQKNAHAVLRRLSNPVSRDTVSDGDLVDAAFAFASRVDLGDPIVPLTAFLLERFMTIANIEETPRGLRRDFFTEVGQV